MKTYDIILTRDSDGLEIRGNIATDANGAAQIALGSEPQSAAIAGRKGKIAIATFHEGSGALVEQQPGHYFSSTGWDLMRPGRARTTPGLAQTLLDATYGNTEFNRGGMFELPIGNGGGPIVITPNAIYECPGDLSAATLIGIKAETAPANTRFTGSYAIFGDRIFFGLESSVASDLRASAAACIVRTGGGTYNGTASIPANVSTATGPPGTLTDTGASWITNQFAGCIVTCNGKTITVASNTATVLTGTAGWSGGGNPGNGNAYTIAGTYGSAGFAASYFCTVGAKLFRCVQNATNPKVAVSWTDQTGSSSPAFTTAYTYPTALYAIDMAQLGPHAVIALGGVNRVDGQLIIMDITGNFTNIVSGMGLPSPVRLIPFGGGVIALVAGPISKSIFLADAQSLSPLSFPDSTTVLPFPTNSGVPGLLDASETGLLAIQKGDVTTTMFGFLADDGLKALEVTWPPNPSITISNTGTVLCGRLVNDSLGDHYLEFVREEEVAGGAHKLFLYRFPLWSGTTIVNTAGTLVKGPTNSLITPFYHGGSFGLKQFLSVSGFGHWFPDGAESTETITLTPYVDGVELAIGEVAGTPDVMTISDADGGWMVYLDDTMIGRGLSLAFSMQNPSSTGLNYELVCPLFVDYMEVPGQRDLINVSILASSLQITRGGSMTKESRRTVLDNIATAIQKPNHWTLKWWDGRPDWTVVPIKYTTKEAEPQARPGEGAAVVTLVLQRLFTTPTMGGVS